MKKGLLLLSVVSVILTAAIFFPYSVHIANSLPNSVDPVFYSWNLMHNYQSGFRGFKDLLDTNIFYPEGNTLALSDTLFIQTILTSPIIALSQNPVLAQNIYILVTFPLSAISMYLLSYYLTKHTWASVLSGIFFAFSYPRLSQIGHMPAISSQWLPLVFLFLIKYFREGSFRNLVLTFFWFLLSITSTVYFGIFLIPLGLITILSHISRISGKMVRDVVLLTIPAIIILAVVLFPYLRLRAEYPGIRRSLEDSSRYSAALIDYASVLPTSWLSDVGFPVNINERALYPTFTLLVLAIPAMFSSWGVFTFTALVLSLGPYMENIKLPYYYLYKVYPLLESVRVPARLSIFVILGLSVLSAMTLARIRNKFLYIIIVLMFLTEVWQIGIPFVRIPLQREMPEVYQFINTTPDSAIILELPLHPVWIGKHMDRQLYVMYEDVTENENYSMEAYRTYFSAFHRKRMINGYSGYFPTVYQDHASVFDKFPTPEAIAAIKRRNVRYILIHANQYVNEPYSDIERRIREFKGLVLVRQFGNDYVYEVR